MTPRVLSVWAGRSANEYITGARTIELAKRLVEIGLHPETITRCLRVAEDELRHATLCRELFECAGGTDPAFPVARDALFWNGERDAPVALRALGHAMQNLAIAETVAVLLYKALREASTEPRVREAMQRFLEDDARHSAFGWDLVDELLEVTGPDGLSWLAGRVPAYVGELRAYYTIEGPPVTGIERGWGLLGPEEYRAVASAALDGEVLPRLARRGLAPRATEGGAKRPGRPTQPRSR